MGFFRVKAYWILKSFLFSVKSPITMSRHFILSTRLYKEQCMNLNIFFLKVAKEGGFTGAFLNIYPRGIITLLNLERKKNTCIILNYISKRSIYKI